MSSALAKCRRVVEVYITSALFTCRVHYIESTGALKTTRIVLYLNGALDRNYWSAKRLLEPRRWADGM